MLKQERQVKGDSGFWPEQLGKRGRGPFLQSPAWGEQHRVGGFRKAGPLLRQGPREGLANRGCLRAAVGGEGVSPGVASGAAGAGDGVGLPAGGAPK